MLFHLGDDISFSGVGLYVKLQGKLVVGYDKNGLILTGNINVPSGNFVIYGYYWIVKKAIVISWKNKSTIY